MIQTVTAKLGTMRKPQTFVTYPRKSATETVIVQSEKAIGQFDPATGKGVLNAKGSKSKGFIFLSPFMGAEPFQFPADFVAAAIAAGVVNETGQVVIFG